MKTITLSVACSIDGYLNDASSERLVLSSPVDLQDIQVERARHDAILVGAGTVRADNPSLRVRDSELVRERKRHDLSAQPARVALTATGDLKATARFFDNDGAQKILVCPHDRVADLSARFDGVASIIGIERPFTAVNMVRALEEEAGIDNLFVEGGAQVLSLFLSSGIFDDFRLAIAPIFVGAQGAPQLHVSPSVGHADRWRLAVTRVRLLGDTTVINFRPEAAHTSKGENTLARAVATYLPSLAMPL